MPDEKTIALGGVATGNMKAQLAASVMGTQIVRTGISACTAIAPTTGKNVAVVARLLVSSVRKITKAVAPITTAKIPNTASGERLWPNHSARPLLANIDARLRPPPKRSNTPLLPV